MNIIRAETARKESNDANRIEMEDLLKEALSVWILERIDNSIKKDSKNGKYQSILYMRDHDGSPIIHGKMLDAVLCRLDQYGYKTEMLDGSLFISWKQN